MNIKKVKEYCKEHNFKCLSNFYINQDNSLRFLCINCKKEFTQSWKQFKRSNSGCCPKCNELNRRKLRSKNNIDKLKKEINDCGSILLSKPSTSDSDDLVLLCKKCKKEFKQTRNAFNKSNFKGYCTKCRYKIQNKGGGKFSYSKVKILIESTGALLISKDYKGSHNKLEIECKNCKKIYKQTLNLFQNSKNPGSCSKCNIEIGNKKKRLAIEDIRNYFESVNCKLLTKTYKNNKQKLDYICSCGNRGKITWFAFRHGTRCEMCRRNKISNTFENLYKDNYNNCPEWEIYKRISHNLSERAYADFKDIINPKGFPRGRNKYHLDHKYSISEGFKNNIPPYIISSIHNLQILTEKDNISKNSKCSISKNELFNNYFNNL